jgi:hypothetical protein
MTGKPRDEIHFDKLDGNEMTKLKVALGLRELDALDT